MEQTNSNKEEGHDSGISGAGDLATQEITTAANTSKVSAASLPLNSASTNNRPKTGGTGTPPVTITTTQLSSSPKKSARLAEKRKLREEAGPVSSSQQDEEFYFTPFKSCRLSSPLTVKGENQISRNEDNDPTMQSAALIEIVSNEEAENLDESSYCNGEDGNQIQHVKLGTSSLADDSSEEDQWFDSLDVGRLEDDTVEIDDIPTSGRLLTERQQSFIFKRDTGYSIGKLEESEGFPTELTATASTLRTNGRSRKEKSERRRVLAQQKKEHDKKRTVDRLLKKPNVVKQAKSSGSVIKTKCKVSEPMITYTIKEDGNFVSLPPGIDVSVFGGGDPPPEKPTAPSNTLRRDPVQCGVGGCLKLKKYTCSKTKIPLCSLECYKKNLLQPSS